MKKTPSLIAVTAILLFAACNQGSEPSVEVETETPEVAAAPPVVAEKTWPPSAEEEALYSERFQTLLEAFASGAPTTAYDPLGPVRGAETERLFAASENGLKSETAALVDTYADANKTQALIVVKDGAILHEAYFHDANPDTLIVGKSLAKPLGVIAVGAAIHQGKISSLDEPVATYIEE